MKDVFTAKLEIYKEFSNVVDSKGISNMPNDVKKMLAYDITQDIYINNVVITARLLDILIEYNLDVTYVVDSMSNVAKKYGEFINDDSIEQLDADELFEFSITSEEFAELSKTNIIND